VIEAGAKHSFKARSNEQNLSNSMRRIAMSELQLNNSGGASGFNRRTFMMTTASASAATALASGCAATISPAGTAKVIGATINGKPQSIQVENRASLLDVLREQLNLTGAKKGCDHGQCGACTVHLDGRRVASCLTLAVKIDGRQVITIEGIASADGSLHPMQQAFVDHDALQCGYCTPGQIMAAIACVREGHATSDDQIREYMSGNLCRCGGYTGILEAINDAASRMKESKNA
jgi:xanthine dehydrogenase YagT iron-sulfur-binding subunit